MNKYYVYEHSLKKYYEEAKRTGKNVEWSKEHRENYYQSILILK